MTDRSSICSHAMSTMQKMQLARQKKIIFDLQAFKNDFLTIQTKAVIKTNTYNVK